MPIVNEGTIKWRAIFAGALISLLAYFILASLGLAIGGDVLADVARGEDAGGFGIGSAIWLVATLLISLFVGSFLAARVSGLIPTRVGAIQGLVIAAVFFAFAVTQVTAGLGFLGRSLGSTIGFMGGAAGDLSQNPQVQNVLREALGDLNLQSPPEVVAQGLATRLLRGDQEGARDYLASQAGISPDEADLRLRQLGADFERVMGDVGETSAQVISAAGWTIFGSLLLGSLFALLGGAAGARRTLKSPVSERDRETLTGPVIRPGQPEPQRPAEPQRKVS